MRLDGVQMRWVNGALRIAVRVQARAGRNEIVGIQAGALKVRIQAPPVDGAANLAIRDLFASVLRVPRARIHIASGHSSRRKTLSIEGMPPEELERRLGPE